MKDKQRKIMHSLLLVVLSGTLVACGSSGSGSGVGNPPSTITAYVAKGPVNNAVCTLYRATDGMVVAGPASSTAGEVDFGETDESGLMYVACVGGAYTDEATGKFATAGTLRAVKNVQGSTEFVITPVTEAAVRLAEARGGIAANGEAANVDVADYLGLDGIDIVTIRPTDLNTTAAGDDAAGRYGTLLNAISLAAADEDGDGSIENQTPSASAMDGLIGNIANAVRDKKVLADTVLDEALSNSSTVGEAQGNVDQGVADSVKEAMGGASVELPALADAAAQTYVKDTAISALEFVNNGGGSLTGCTATPSLPAGLTVDVSSDSSTCEITGTPTAVQSATDHTITATNATGSDTAIVNITVTASLAAPVLADASAQTYTQGAAITALAFSNSGGGSLSACTVAPSLPAGLTVDVSSDSSTCEITGTPTAVQSATDYTITATNATGSDTATVSITVNPAMPALADASAQTYTQGTAITALAFSNSGGGSLSACTVTPSLPVGLTVDVSSNSSTCEITGTPTGIQGATTYTVTATNVTGSDTATVSITVNSNPIITGVSPSTGSAAGGTLITISGSNFNGVTSVTVGGNAATSVTTASATSVTAVTPNGTVTGSAVDVVVTNGDGQTATDVGAFTYRNACEDCELDANGCPF